MWIDCDQKLPSFFGVVPKEDTRGFLEADMSCVDLYHIYATCLQSVGVCVLFPKQLDDKNTGWKVLLMEPWVTVCF